MIEIIQAIFLGVIEGLTEFLPVSSTGHLIVAQEMIGYKDTAKVFTVVIQMGAIAAIIWNYRRDLLKKTIGLLKREKQAVHFWKIWILATVPAGIFGFLMRDQLSVYAVAKTVAIALIAGGVIIWLIETFHQPTKNPEGTPQFKKISLKQALQVGLFQMLAVVPGVSRSGASIMGGLLSGLDRVTAAAFSFYLSIPILLLAGGYQLAKGEEGFSTVQGGAAALVAGTIAAFITALVVIRWLLSYISNHSFKIFAYYRIIIGIGILLVIT